MKKTMEKITLLSLSLMLTSTFAVSTALPAMLGFFQGYGQEQVEMLISVPSLAITVMILMNTWFARYIKESVMITAGLVLLTVNGIVPVFFQNYSVVLISRILFGFGIGLINARAITMISERYEGNEKSVLLGYRGSAEVLGNAVMTLVVGRLLLIKWNYAFWVYAFGLVILFLYWIFIPEKNLKSRQEHTSQKKRSFTKKERMITAWYTVLAGIVICINASNSLRIPMVVLERKFGTETDASVILSIMMVVGIFAGVCFGKLAVKCRERLITYGLFLLGAGLLIMNFAGNIVVIGIGAVVAGFFYVISLTCIFNGLSDQLPQELGNTATSVVLLGCNLGAACSPIVLKAISTVSDGAGAHFVVYACAAAAAGGIAAGIEKKNSGNIQKKSSEKREDCDGL